MWKRKLPSGKWQYGTTYTDPLTGIEHQATITLIKKNDHIGQEQLCKKITNIIAATGKPSEITFGELCRRNVEHTKQYCKPQTAISTQGYMNTLKRLIGENVIVSTLNAPIVSKYLHDINVTTYNDRLKRFKVLMRWGYAEDLVEDVKWLDKLKPMKCQPVREKDRYKYLEHDEITKLFDGMKNEKWKLLSEFLILSGLRIGEAIALNDDDVDMTNKVIHITKTYAPAIKAISSTKTQMSCRDVYMQPELYDCCHRIKIYIKREQMIFAYRSDIFIPNVNTGSYIPYNTFEYYVRRNTERLIGRRLTSHAFRHTHVAMLAENSVSLDTIMRRVGHADSRTTKDIYMHVTKNMKWQDAQQISIVKIINN